MFLSYLFKGVTEMAQENVNPPVDPNLNVDPNANPTLPIVEDGNDRIKKDMLKYKDEAARLQAQVEDMKLRGHKEKEDWKTVAEHHEGKSKDFEAKFNGLKDSLIQERKISALTIEAQKHGINPASLSDLELLDFDEVSVETTSTGKILVSGQDRAIAKLKTLRPHWFTTSVPNVNPANPNVLRPNSGDHVSLADLNAAEANYRKTKSELDKKIYSELIQKYKAQNG
jgi:hypothetical protein